MKTVLTLLLIMAGSVLAADQIPNRLIDYNAFAKLVLDSGPQREAHRLTEQQFAEAMSDKNILILDARSASKYALRHIKGAVNLPFSDFTAETLARVIPSTASKVLIYCNNNFEGSPAAFAGKAPAASLNLSTYTSLRAYGYENVFELGPLLHVGSTSIPFEGSEVQ
jgi:phage shock protein E